MEQVTTDCPYCTPGYTGALYDFGCPRCRERFLCAEPRLAVRRAWLDQFERTHGQDEVDRLKGVLEQHFRARGWQE